MTCEEVQESISAYADGEIRPDEEVSMFTHIGACRECRKFLRSVLDLRGAVASAAPVDVPASLDRRVRAIRPGAMRAAPGRRRWLTELWMRRLSVPLPSAALVAFVLISMTVLSLSLLLKPNQVPVATLPPVDVYLENPSQPTHIH